MQIILGSFARRESSEAQGALRQARARPFSEGTVALPSKRRGLRKPPIAAEQTLLAPRILRKSVRSKPLARGRRRGLRYVEAHARSPRRACLRQACVPLPHC